MDSDLYLVRSISGQNQISNLMLAVSFFFQHPAPREGTFLTHKQAQRCWM